MVLLILLFISIILQLFAAGVAIRLTRTTKFNASWILITIALVVMCVMRIDELGQALAVKFDGRGQIMVMPEGMYAWAGVVTSLCFAAGVFFIKKILSYISLREEQRRRSEERVLSAVIRAEENQRQIISKELHDGLGPLLSSARMSVSALSGLPLEAKQRKILENAEYVIGEAVKSLTEISNNLSPHVLNNFGVARALNTFINKLQPICHTQMMFTTNMRDVRINPDREVILYRVVCELINNTLKHADAETLTIHMSQERDVVTVRFEDNGCGFDTEVDSEGMGLSNIASRISSIKGTLEITSRIGEGTRVYIQINAK